MSDYVASLIRTYVPILVTTLVTWLGSIGVVLPADASDQLALFVGTLAGAVYYALVRLLEKKFPWVGGFLGAVKSPVYVKPSEVEPEKATETVAEVVAKVENLYTDKTLAA